MVVRSHCSLMWGTSAPEDLAIAARQHGYQRIALTDTDNLYGLWPFLQACREHEVTPIVGAELSEPGSQRRVVCLVENDDGYRNLCRLITRRHCKKDFTLESDLPVLAAGLTVLVPGAELLAPFHQAGVTVAAALPRRPSQSAAKARAEARRLGVPAVAVLSSFFLVPDDHEVHRLLRAIARNTSFSRLKSDDVAPADAWLAPPAHYERRFDVWPETLAASDDIAERLTFTGPNLGLVMPPWRANVGQPSCELLRERCYAGARKRYGSELHETVVDRIEYELATIERMGFSSYFLVVEEIVKRSPRICGRGSGAASIVAYSLGITNVCPVKFNLYFERFLNPGRKDPPDIDVDFAWDERDAAIASVLDEFRDHSAMVACFANFQPRMAIRETAKVFGLTDAEIGQVSKRLPWFWREVGNDDDDLIERLRDLPELKDLDFPEPWPEILQLAQRLIGIPRHISVHPGGVVITPEPLDSYVPIEMAPKGVPIIQWEKDSTETAGLVKIDLLGNRSLAVVRVEGGRGGLEIGNGIIVNSYLQTSHPGIYAAGDNAQFPYPALGQVMRVEHWDNAFYQGILAGKNMSGAHEPYSYMPYFFSDLFEFGYEAVGEVDSSLETFADWQKENDTGVVYYLKNGKVRGAMMCNVWNQVASARQIIQRAESETPAGLKGAIR